MSGCLWWMGCCVDTLGIDIGSRCQYHWGIHAGWFCETPGNPWGIHVVQDAGEGKRVGMGMACNGDGIQGMGKGGHGVCGCMRQWGWVHVSGQGNSVHIMLHGAWQLCIGCCSPGCIISQAPRAQSLRVHSPGKVAHERPYNILAYEDLVASHTNHSVSAEYMDCGLSWPSIIILSTIRPWITSLDAPCDIDCNNVQCVTRKHTACSIPQAEAWSHDHSNKTPAGSEGGAACMAGRYSDSSVFDTTVCMCCIREGYCPQYTMSRGWRGGCGLLQRLIGGQLRNTSSIPQEVKRDAATCSDRETWWLSSQCMTPESEPKAKQW